MRWLSGRRSTARRWWRCDCTKTCICVRLRKRLPALMATEGCRAIRGMRIPMRPAHLASAFALTLVLALSAHSSFANDEQQIGVYVVRGVLGFVAEPGACIGIYRDDNASHVNIDVTKCSNPIRLTFTIINPYYSWLDMQGNPGFNIIARDQCKRMLIKRGDAPSNINVSRNVLSFDEDIPGGNQGGRCDFFTLTIFDGSEIILIDPVITNHPYTELRTVQRTIQ
jgi:hypothetical protein